jgi:hypothetical protein
MMTGKNDDAASRREDSFLARLIPQVTENLAERHAGTFDAEAGQERFLTWLTEHTEVTAAPEPAAPAKDWAGAGQVRRPGTGLARRSGAGRVAQRPGGWKADLPKIAVARITGGWEPALAPVEAARLAIPRNEYEQAALFARMTVVEHRQLGTSRNQWEPTPTGNDKLAAPFIVDGEQELASRLEREADPALDKVQGLVEKVKVGLYEIAQDTRPITAPESGTGYSVAEAVNRVREHDKTIGQDEAGGRHHHRRASTLLRRLATWAPWVAAGFLTFVSYYLNVALQSRRDWLGWLVAVMVVAVIVLGQTWLVRQAAASHNYARTDLADGHRHEADRGFRRRNWYLLGTAVTALAVTGGIIWRGTAALGSASTGTTTVLVFIAAVTSLLLPTLAYPGIALDGSTVSRERDGLAAALDDDLDDYLQTISDSRRDLAAVEEIGVMLKTKTFPDICHATQEAVDGVYGFYGTVRLLIGGLSADPPPRTTKTINVDPTGTISGYIGTSIPGADAVNLDPLFDRQHRLDEIETQRASLLNRIDALPSHPWGKSRT